MARPKVFVLTMAVTDRMYTHKLVEPSGMEVHWVTHDPADRDRLVNELGIDKDRIHLHGLKRKDAKALGTAVCGWIRDWIQDNLVSLDEWYVMMDDDVEQLHVVHEDYYDYDRIDFQFDVPDKHLGLEGQFWRHDVYKTPVTPDQFPAIVQELQDKCIEVGTIYGGFAHAENYYFRSNKWSYMQIIPGTFILYKNDGDKWLRYPHVAHEDVVKTYATIARYGKICCNKFVFVITEYGEATGIGSLDSRMPNLIKTCDSLMEEFPGLLKHYKGNRHQPCPAMRSLKRIQKWREEHGFA